MSKHTSKALLGNVWHRYVRHHWLKLVVAVFFMLLEAGSMYVFVKSLQPLLDDVLTGKDASRLVPITLIICGVFVVRGVGSFIHRSLTVNTGVHIVGQMQKDLMHHLMILDVGYFNRNAPGGLIERVRGDTQALQALVSSTLLTVGRDSATLVGMLAAAINMDWRWTLIMFVGAPVLVLPIGYLQRVIRKFSRRARASSATLSTRLDEIFHGIRAIKLNNLKSHEMDRFEGTVDQFVKTSLSAQYSSAALPSVIDIIAGVGFVAVIYYGGGEIINGDKTAGSFMTFFAAVALMFDPIRRLTNVSGAIQRALANLERIYDIFDEQPTPRPTAKKPGLDHPSGDIEFRDVSFSYGDVPVLNGLSFVAPGGKTTALVGPSGAGKSTIFNLLSQLELPTSGDICIGQERVCDIQLDVLRKQMAIVSQESALFDESIEDNIWLGDLTRPEESVKEAARLAMVTEFTDDLAFGLKSLAGPRGSNLSGGQRQRVIIARALLRDAPILLLDEATSALDTRTEQKIQQVLNDFSHAKTSIVIAHRLSTVMDADVIHVIKDGKVMESGSHEELLESGTHYRELYRALEQ